MVRLAYDLRQPQAERPKAPATSGNQLMFATGKPLRLPERSRHEHSPYWLGSELPNARYDRRRHSRHWSSPGPGPIAECDRASLHHRLVLFPHRARDWPCARGSTTLATEAEELAAWRHQPRSQPGPRHGVAACAPFARKAVSPVPPVAVLPAVDLCTLPREVEAAARQRMVLR